MEMSSQLAIDFPEKIKKKKKQIKYKIRLTIK